MGAGRDLFGLRKDGSEFPVEIGLNPIETDEGTMVLAAIVDISKRKQYEELTARIADQIGQPPAAIVANASAGLRWLTNKTPDLDEARAALKAVVSAGHRAGELVGSVRAMFKRDHAEQSRDRSH